MYFIISSLICILVTLKSIDILIGLGNKFKILDYPDSRKKNFIPKVRIGGFSILIGSFSFVAISFFLLRLENYEISRLLEITIICSILIYFVGLMEDFLTTSPFLRLFLQIIVASLAFKIGLVIRFDFLDNIFDQYLLNILSYLFTCFWIVGGINAINWLDGLDGLASGLSSILFIALSIFSFSLNLIPNAIFASSIAISSFGFTLKNSYPSKILMGDGGSYFLGFTLSGLSICLLNSRYLDDISLLNIIKYYSPLFILALPYFDFVRVILTRLINGNSPFFPDRLHIHYRLLDSGIRYGFVVNLLYIICFLTLLPTLIINLT